MRSIEEAYQEVCTLHERLTQRPAPEIAPHSFVPFPAGADPVEFAIREVTQLKQIIDRSQTAQPASPVAWIPRANILASESEVQIYVEIPGVTREDVAVTLSGGELIVRGERRPAAPEGDLKPMCVEQAWGPFERRFPAPPWCRSESIQANYRNGLLEIGFSRGDGREGDEVQVSIG